jgi:hypothetical protein
MANAAKKNPVSPSLTEDEKDIGIALHRLKTERPMSLEAALKQLGYDVDSKTGAVSDKRSRRVYRILPKVMPRRSSCSSRKILSNSLIR